MAAVKEFHTSVKKRDRDEVKFMLDGVEVVAQRPKESALMFVAMSTSEDATPGDQIRSMYDFLKACLDQEARDLLARRLKDPDDNFDFTDITTLFTWLVESFAEVPTVSPSASSAGRRRSGVRSTAT